MKRWGTRRADAMLHAVITVDRWTAVGRNELDLSRELSRNDFRYHSAKAHNKLCKALPYGSTALQAPPGHPRPRPPPPSLLGDVGNERDDIADQLDLNVIAC